MNFTKYITPAFSLLVIAMIISCSSTYKSISSSAQYPETKLGWKLGAQAYTFNLFTFSEAIDKIDSCGLRYVEGFSGQTIGGGIEGKMDYYMNASLRKQVLDKLKKKGVTMYAYGVETPGNEAEWRQLFEFGKAMGIQTFTSEPEEKDMPLLSTLCDAYKINLAIHNHPYPKHYWKPEIVLAAIKGQSGRIGACADVGHWVRSGLDPVECLKKLQGHVLQLHWGTGIANTNGVITELKRQNFKGMISAEYERNWENNVPDVTASVVYFRSVLR